MSELYNSKTPTPTNNQEVSLICFEYIHAHTYTPQKLLRKAYFELSDHQCQADPSHLPACIKIHNANYDERLQRGSTKITNRISYPIMGPSTMNVTVRYLIRSILYAVRVVHVNKIKVSPLGNYQPSEQVCVGDFASSFRFRRVYHRISTQYANEQGTLNTHDHYILFLAYQHFIDVTAAIDVSTACIPCLLWIRQCRPCFRLHNRFSQTKSSHLIQRGRKNLHRRRRQRTSVQE